MWCAALRCGDAEEDRPARPAYRVAKVEDLPGSSDEDGGGDGGANDGLANIDLTLPLRADEVMPVRSHRVVVDAASKRGKKHSSSGGGKKKKKDGDKDKDGAAAAAASGSGSKGKDDDKSGKKKKKSEKDRDVEEDKGGKDKKAKKSSKDKDKDVGGSSRSVGSASTPTAAGGAGPVDDSIYGKSGDSVAYSDAYNFVLYADKVIKVRCAAIPALRW
jgi:hypothetical protein